MSFPQKTNVQNQQCWPTVWDSLRLAPISGCDDGATNVLSAVLCIAWSTNSQRLTCNVQYIYYSRFTCLVFIVLIMFPDPGKCSHKAASQNWPIITLGLPLQPYKYGCTGVTFTNSTQQLPLYYVSIMNIELRCNWKLMVIWHCLYVSGTKTKTYHHHCKENYVALAWLYLNLICL